MGMHPLNQFEVFDTFDTAALLQEHSSLGQEMDLTKHGGIISFI